MSPLLSFGIFLLVPFIVKAGDNDKCLIRGTCGPNPSGSVDPLNHQPNCLNCKLPEPEDQTGIDKDTTDLLYLTCPHFRAQFGEWSNETIDTEYGTHFDVNPKVCCTRRQIEIMHTSFGQAEDLLARCPVCYGNWRKNFCAMTCLPGEFLQVSRYEDNPDEEMLLNATQAPCGGFDSGPDGAYTDVDPGKISTLFTIYLCI